MLFMGSPVPLLALTGAVRNDAAASTLLQAEYRLRTGHAEAELGSQLNHQDLKHVCMVHFIVACSSLVKPSLTPKSALNYKLREQFENWIYTILSIPEAAQS